MIEVYNKYKDPVISAVRVPQKYLNKYGIAKVKDVEDKIFEIEEIIEKPEPDQAPSDLAAHGAYILTPDIFEALKNIKPGKGNEIWLVDGINALRKNHKIYAREIENGRYYDTGNKLEYLKANVEFGLKRDDLKEEFSNYLKDIVK